MMGSGNIKLCNGLPVSPEDRPTAAHQEGRITPRRRPEGGLFSGPALGGLLVTCVSSLAIVACMTPAPSLHEAVGPQAQPPPGQPQPGQQHTDTMTAGELLDHLKSIELAYARGLCDQVLARSDILRGVIVGPAASSAPLSTLLAMSECAARLAPQDTTQSDRAVGMMDTTLTNLTPPWDKSYLLNLKAARLESQGRTDAALAVRRQIAALGSDRRRDQVINQMAMVRLDPRASGLSPSEKNRLATLLEQAMDDEKLFETLRTVDAAAASVSLDGPGTQAAWVALLRDLREQLLLRIEERFSIDLLQVVKLLQSAARAEAEQLVAKLKLAYPSVSFQKRLDATLAAYASGDAALPLPAQQGSTAAATDTSDMTEAQRLAMASQALASGRPDEAVQLLRSVPEASRSQEMKKRLAEAESVHIRDLRLRVRDILQRASSRVRTSDRAADYRQALEILRYILKEYPQNDARKQIERNVRSIEFNLSQINERKDSVP